LSVINNLFKERKISRINDLEIERYINFFEVSYKDNIDHSYFVLEKYPRWSIISGYYTMHDITKLFFVKKYGLKVNKQEAHATTIALVEELTNEKEITKLLKDAYDEFKGLSLELSNARNERSKAQYYTGSYYAFEYFYKRAEEFYKDNSKPYINKMLKLIGG
jgi:hypothetical protein